MSENLDKGLKSITTIKRLIFVIPYLGLIFWFKTHNIFDPSQAYSDISYRAYGFLRLFYLFYFSWLLYAVGAFLLAQLNKRPVSKLGMTRLDQLILAFFTGAGVIRIGMFILGLLNLYYHLLLAILSIIIIFWSYPRFESLASECYDYAKNKFAHTQRILQLFYLVLGLVLIYTFAFLFIMQGQLIVDPDYLLHYGAYHHRVIDNHGIWPNQIWQHHFFSRGAGLNFFSIMLTDRMASPLTKIGLFGGTVLIMISLLRHVSKSWAWGLAGGAIYTTAFLYFPVDATYPGYFEKHHGMIGSIVISIVWLSIIMQTRPIMPVKIWLFCGSSMLIGLIILSEPSSFFVFTYLGIYLIFNVLKRDWPMAKILFFWLAAGSIVLISLMSFDYLTTGLFALVPYQMAVSFLDQAKFSQWGSPYMVYYIDEGLNMGVDWYRVNQDLTQTIEELIQPQQLSWLLRFDRISYLFPHIIITGVVILSTIVAILYRRRWPARFVQYVFGPTAVMLLIILAAYIAVPQPISVYRQLTYTIFFTVLMAVALWRLWLEWVVPVRFQANLSRIIIVFMVIGTLFTSIPPDPFTQIRLVNRFGFFFGIVEIPEAYVAEWRMPLSLMDMRKSIGLKERIVTLSASPHYSLIFLMGRGLEMDLLAYSFGPDWHIMMFENSDMAKKAYQKQGINHFFIDTSVNVYGAIPFSSLFEPENINQYFKIVWHDEFRYILTWRTPADTTEIPAIVIEEWKATLNNKVWEPFQTEILHDRVDSIYRFNNRRVTDIYIP